MIVASYFTDDRYKRYAERLASSASRIGLASVLYPMPDSGSWQRNVNMKALVVQRALAEHLLDDVLYVDADAVFRKYPTELDAVERDLAAVFCQGRPISATLLIKNSLGGRDIVRAWVEECDKHQDQHDDVVNLHAALLRLGGKRAIHLPPSYYWDEREMRSRFPKAEPVVEHFNIGEHTFPAPK